MHFPIIRGITRQGHKVVLSETKKLVSSAEFREKFDLFATKMSLQRFLNHNRFLKADVRSIVARFAHHDTSVKPINEPPNDHLPFRPAILDDLPVPEGDWLEDYRKRNRKYWMHFFMGLTALSATLYFMYEYEPVFFNHKFPEMPPKEERIKSFWIPPEDDDDDDDEE